MMKMEDKVFIDTNILVYLTDETSEFYKKTYDIFFELLKGNELYFSYQVIREYSVVVTRHGRIKMPLSTSDLLVSISKWKKVLWICDENKGVHNCLMKLINDYGINGKRIHDANIVATMVNYGIKNLFTYNIDDFKNFKEVELIK